MQSVERVGSDFRTVTALGLEIERLTAKAQKIEQQMDGSDTDDERRRQRSWEELLHDVDALSAQALSKRARTVSDAQVQLQLVYPITEGLADCPSIPHQHQVRIEQLGRILASVAGVFADDAAFRLGARAAA